MLNDSEIDMSGDQYGVNQFNYCSCWSLGQLTNGCHVGYIIVLLALKEYRLCEHRPPNLFFKFQCEITVNHLFGIQPLPNIHVVMRPF